MIELEEIEDILKGIAKRHKPGKWKPESYIGAGQSEFKFLNIRVPLLRSRQKEGYSFSDKDIKYQWRVWDFVWKNSKYFEAPLLAAHFANSRPVDELYLNRKKLLSWINRVDNWALSDELSNIYSKLLEHKQDEFLPVFKRWSKSKNPWKRRQSLVGLLYYSRFRKQTLPCSIILNFIQAQLEDQHFYVQKGVGWTLRECWNIHPQKTQKFMEKHAAAIPPAGWTAATEKLSKMDKNRLKLIRKSH